MIVGLIDVDGHNFPNFPRGGGSPKYARVAATASRIMAEAIPAPSFRKAEQTQAPAH